MKEIKTVSIVGANGTMGFSVGGIFASFGNCKVYMVARKKEAAEKSVLSAAATVKAESVSKRLIAKTYEDFKEIIPESDLVFESVAEDLSIKKEINNMIAKYIREDAIVATGTSGLSVTELSESFKGGVKARYTGTHFFNPPYQLTLCEVIPTIHTDKAWLGEYKEYLSKVLRRAVVEIKDAPGFLGNRIGFQLMNEVLQFAEINKDKGGIDYMDAILGSFSGRAMPPIATVNFVGLDVHKAIVDNLYDKTDDYAHDTFVLPGFVQEQINKGELGMKTGAGLYKTLKNEDGSRTRQVYDIATKSFRNLGKYDFPFVKKMNNALRISDYKCAFDSLINDDSDEAKLCLTFILKFVLYSLVTADAVAEKPGDADICMVTGYNWAPPIGIIVALGGADKVKELMKEYIPAEWLNKVDINKLIHDGLKPEYDYRRYFRSGR